MAPSVERNNSDAHTTLIINVSDSYLTVRKTNELIIYLDIVYRILFRKI